jgi:hypothetical protein
VSGAVARQRTEFGDASGYGMLGGEHFTMAEGTDLGPLLEGLENDLCQSPHWGYMIGGKLAVSYQDGRSEATNAGDLFYWPPGHTVKAEPVPRTHFHTSWRATGATYTLPHLSAIRQRDHRRTG